MSSTAAAFVRAAFGSISDLLFDEDLSDDLGGYGPTPDKQTFEKWAKETQEPSFVDAIERDDVEPVRAWLLDGMRECPFKLGFYFFVPFRALRLGPNLTAYIDHVNNQQGVEGIHANHHRALYRAVKRKARHTFDGFDERFKRFAVHVAVAFTASQDEHNGYTVRERWYLDDAVPVFHAWLNAECVRLGRALALYESWLPVHRSRVIELVNVP